MRRALGFSLVEVLCAVMILGIGVVGITQGLTLSLRSTKDAERRTHAAFLAEGRLEELRADGFVTEGEETGDFGEGFPGYRWRQTITETSPPGLHEVLVAVEDDGSGEVLFELTTMLFDPPYSYSLESSAGGSGNRRDLSPGLRRKGAP